MSQWKKCFVDLLEGTEKRATANEGQDAQEIEEIENVEDLTDREIDKQLKRLKRKKAPGKDGVRNEAWIYSVGRTRGRVRELMREIWRGGRFL